MTDQQPLYDPHSETDDTIRQPGETDTEYAHRMIDQARNNLPAKGTR